MRVREQAAKDRLAAERIHCNHEAHVPAGILRKRFPAAFSGKRVPRGDRAFKWVRGSGHRVELALAVKRERPQPAMERTAPHWKIPGAKRVKHGRIGVADQHAERLG